MIQSAEQIFFRIMVAILPVDAILQFERSDRILYDGTQDFVRQIKSMIPAKVRGSYTLAGKLPDAAAHILDSVVDGVSGTAGHKNTHLILPCLHSG